MIKMPMLNDGRKIRFRNLTPESVELGILLAIVGGFLDAYTFVGRGGVFANAQTGNVVLMGIEAATGEWGQAMLHAVPILAFIVGVVVAEMIKKPSMRLFIPDSERAVLILEIAVLFIIGFIPYTSPNIIVTVAVSFVSSVQVSSFRKLVDSPYSTTMITGNLRSATQEAYIAFTKKDRESALQAFRYSTINLSFLAGAILGGLLTLFIGVKAVWVAVSVLICSVILFSMNERKNKKVDVEV
ncbi:membrane protein [Methanosarcina sp. 2.H.A.1B.4]|nr:membrane protein [Methanosarcina sp. 2.H.A.1B.4]